MSPTVVTEETIEGEDIIVTRKKAGDFVVCNLSSVNLGRAVPDGVLERLIRVQVRMLDNVIDLNNGRIEVKQAVITNKKLRAVGLGVFSWHHLLAIKGIRWESAEAVEYADKLHEEIAFLTINASADLAREKGAYPRFAGSEWDTGAFFDARGYHTSESRFDWDGLRQKICAGGIRNGYLQAVAPTASTSVIAGGTASIDGIFQREYAEEKKDYKIPVTVPDLSEKTWFYYKSAHDMDQKWAIKQNAARQRHVDQGISFNLYVRSSIQASDLLDLHLTAWKSGLKTTYYVRSTTVDNDDCESCT